MKQVRIRVHNTWPAGRAAGGDLDQTRHNVWCKALRKEVAYRRDNGFDVTDEMQNIQKLDVIVYMHTDRAGRKATNNTDAYRDCIRQSLLEAHLTNSTERIERLRVVAEPKSKPEKPLRYYHRHLLEGLDATKQSVPNRASGDCRCDSVVVFFLP